MASTDEPRKIGLVAHETLSSMHDARDPVTGLFERLGQPAPVGAVRCPSLGDVPRERFAVRDRKQVVGQPPSSFQ
jgi:hypothetical protein